ncbi:tail fiber assembly protein [Pseudomonas fulva]|uniref:tail fiber assembly protein n=1 Tax=Pseudomonas fulva TaxID=47880 RepID=UPI0009DFE18F|nr:tail fiber assembly protein [Pseudomonas fulva]
MTDESTDLLEQQEVVAPEELPEVVDLRPWWQREGVQAPQVCNVHRGTGEFLGVCVADPSPLEPDVWAFPAYGYPIAPPDVQAGFAALINRDASGWEIVADHRGATVYSTETGEPRQWLALGDLPEGYTLQAPESEFDTWQGDKWAPDEGAIAEAARQAAYLKQQLANQYATARISTLQDAVSMDMATEAEAEALKAWKVYRVELNRLDITTTAPADDDWPGSPNDEALAVWLASQTH